MLFRSKDLFVPPPRGVNPGLEIRATACFDIATSFQRLHATGYCYQDINFGGFFIDAERGTIQICDADNIAVDGEPGGVYGTRKFMAPEWCAGKPCRRPRPIFTRWRCCFFT